MHKPAPKEQKHDHAAVLLQLRYLRASHRLLLALVRELHQKQETIMSALDDIRAKLAIANTAIDAVRQDILDIKAAIPTSGAMTAEETASVLSDVTSLADKITALDAENPTPPVV